MFYCEFNEIYGFYGVDFGVNHGPVSKYWLNLQSQKPGTKRLKSFQGVAVGCAIFLRFSCQKIAIFQLFQKSARAKRSNRPQEENLPGTKEEEAPINMFLVDCRYHFGPKHLFPDEKGDSVAWRSCVFLSIVLMDLHTRIIWLHVIW